MKLCIPVLLASLLLGSAAIADPGILDFEDAAVQTPGGDDSPVSNQYLASFGVTFSVLAGPTKATAVPGLPTYEDWGTSGGDPNRGFLYGGDYGGTQGYDKEAPPAAGGLGGWFLKSTNDVATTGYVKLIINYSTRIAAASGEIWDIDGVGTWGTEQWEVTAFDAQDNVVDSILSPRSDLIQPGALDGLPWLWTVSSQTGIAKIEIEFVGTKTDNVGLAFDNFTPEIPEPASLLLLALGAVTGLRRR